MWTVDTLIYYSILRGHYIGCYVVGVKYGGKDVYWCTSM